MLIGDSGHGKSAFINNIANKTLAEEGHRKESCTIQPQCYNANSFTLVDT